MHADSWFRQCADRLQTRSHCVGDAVKRLSLPRDRRGSCGHPQSGTRRGRVHSEGSAGYWACTQPLLGEPQFLARLRLTPTRFCADPLGSPAGQCGLRTLLRPAAAAVVESPRRRCPYHDGSVGSPSPAARAMTVVRNAAEAGRRPRVLLSRARPAGGLFRADDPHDARSCDRSSASPPPRGGDLNTFRRGDRKGDRTQECRRQWPGGEGVLYIGDVQEKARVPRTRGETDPVTGFRPAPLHFCDRDGKRPTASTLSTKTAGPCFLSSARTSRWLHTCA